VKRLHDILFALLLAVWTALPIYLVVLSKEQAPHIAAALVDLRSKASATLDQVQATEKKQDAHLDEEMIELRKATAGASDLLRHTDITLNGTREHPGAIPQATTLIVKAQPVMDNLAMAARHTDEAIQNLNAVVTSGGATVQELQAALAQVDRMVGDLDAQVTDPAIKDALANLSKAAQNAAGATEQLAAIATDGRQVADKARETYLKPVNLWWGLVKTLLPLAGSAAQVVK
jgi:hypothetical protein